MSPLKQTAMAGTLAAPPSGAVFNFQDLATSHTEEDGARAVSVEHRWRGCTYFAWTSREAKEENKFITISCQRG